MNIKKYALLILSYIFSIELQIMAMDNNSFTTDICDRDAISEVYTKELSHEYLRYIDSIRKRYTSSYEAYVSNLNDDELKAYVSANPQNFFDLSIYSSEISFEDWKNGDGRKIIPVLKECLSDFYGKVKGDVVENLLITIEAANNHLTDVKSRIWYRVSKQTYISILKEILEWEKGHK